MSDTIIYKGRGTPDMYDDLMDFINYVFGFNGNESDFKKLLPKLYEPECDPCHANYVITENGKLKAAVGAFDSELSVCGEILKVRGIGNVAVHPYSRSKGYMIDCMNMALSDMIKDGVDLSLLSGRRQRYNHFGFETAGTEYSVTINQNNIRYVFGDSPLDELQLREVKSDDNDLLDQMYELHRSRPEYAVRPRDKFYDICRSWRQPVTAILRGGTFVGYFIGNITELVLASPSDFNDFIRSYVSRRGKVTLHIPSWDTAILDQAAEICEYMTVGDCDMFNIFSYKNVLSALLKFRCTYSPPADGELTVLIHGSAGDEKLKLSVSGGISSVSEYSSEHQLELEHREAITFFFGKYSPKRARLKPEIRDFFPLPLYVENADHV